jgi:hypothetical protein
MTATTEKQLTIADHVRGCDDGPNPYTNVCRAEFKLPHPLFKEPFYFLWGSLRYAA